MIIRIPKALSKVAAPGWEVLGDVRIQEMVGVEEGTQQDTMLQSLS